MDLKRTRRVENIIGIVIISCVLAIACIEMNPLIEGFKAFIILSLCWGYLFILVFNRYLKASKEK